MINKNTFTAGRFAVTPLAKKTAAGYAASVSIRRGLHDRVYRFIQSFDTEWLALRYAMAQGRLMALSNELN